MNVGGIGGAGFFGQLRLHTPVSGGVSVASLQRQRRVSELETLHTRTLEARQSFVRLLDQLGESLRRGAAGEPSQRVSTRDLDLLTEDTSARLESSEEINALTTSYSPYEPTWHGVSTSDVVVSGAYEGSEDDKINVWVMNTGFVGGLTPVDLEVRDRTGDVIETLTLTPSSEEQSVELSNGLVLTFSLGLLQSGNWFAFDVSANTPSAVDPDKAFDEVGSDRPNFEPGLSVGSGSFDVNGTPILVRANDTIHTVLQRINASGAGVTATFDSTSETIRFEQDTPGADATIVLENDTSGFLAATKLDTAQVESGRWNEVSTTLDSLDRFSGVTAGVFELNGVTISLDPSLDSLEDLLARISSSDAGVSASYDESKGRVRLRTEAETPSLSVDSDTTGILDVLGLEEGTTDAQVGERSSLSSMPHTFLSQAAAKLGKLFGTVNLSSKDEETAIGRALGRVVSQTASSLLGKRISSSADHWKTFGLDFRFGDDGSTTLAIDSEALTAALRRDPDEVIDFLLADRSGEGHDGILPRLIAELESQERDLADTLGGLGIFVDVLA